MISWSSNLVPNLTILVVNYICVVLYNLSYMVLTYMISLNPRGSSFLSPFMDDEEIGSRAHLRSQSWSMNCWVPP